MIAFVNPPTARRLLCLLVCLISVTPAAGAMGATSVTAVRVPDGGTYPQAAADSKGRIHLLYVKGDPMAADAFYVRSDDQGKSFGKPIRVNSHPGSVIIMGTVRGPHLALGRGDRVHVAWMGSGKAEPRAGKLAPMLYTRLTDGGDSFEPERNVVSAHPGLDGGGSVAADTDGNVYVAWHAPMEHGRSDSEEERHVWVARSKDDGTMFLPETRANPKADGVCACCGMRVFAGTNGKVFVLYRRAKDLVNRDVQLLASADFGKTFSVAASDPWQVAKCVMSTASFAQTKSGDALGAWETKEQVRLGRVPSDTKEAINLRDAPGFGKNRKHPSLAVNEEGMVLLAWTEGTSWGKGGVVAWQVFDGSGNPVPARAGRAAGLPAWSVPAAVSLPGGSFLVIY